MISVSLEPVAWVLRVHPGPDGDYRLKSPYGATATVTVDDLGCATIRGLAVDQFDRATAEAFNVAFRKAEILEVLWTRKKPGEEPRVFRHKVR